MIFIIRRDLFVILIINMNIVFYEGACNFVIVVEIVRSIFDVGSIERVDY